MTVPPDAVQITHIIDRLERIAQALEDLATIAHYVAQRAGDTKPDEPPPTFGA